MNSKKFWRRWWLSVLCGRWRKQTLHNYLQHLAVREYAGQLFNTRVESGKPISNPDYDFWCLPEVKQYWLHDLPHFWRAALAGGGSTISLPNKTRDEAIQSLMLTAPRATVMSVDDNLHFIFYKLPQD